MLGTSKISINLLVQKLLIVRRENWHLKVLHPRKDFKAFVKEDGSKKKWHLWNEKKKFLGKFFESN